MVDESGRWTRSSEAWAHDKPDNVDLDWYEIRIDGKDGHDSRFVTAPRLDDVTFQHLCIAINQQHDGFNNFSFKIGRGMALTLNQETLCLLQEDCIEEEGDNGSSFHPYKVTIQYIQNADQIT